MYNLQNRRYLWNKFKLLNFILEVIKKENIKFNSFTDLFAWTWVVWDFFNDKNTQIISNDILKSNYCSLHTFLDTKKDDYKEISNYLDILNNLEIPEKENYVSINYGDKYFDKKNSLLIWKIREEINNMKISDSERNILLSSLVYSIDKVANTCWHYAAFRKRLDNYPRIKLELPNVKVESNVNNKVFNKDANDLVKEIETDILYIDPPYNSRQYFNSYHVPENIIKWDNAELEWVTKQRKDRKNYKSEYCTVKAKDIFSDLVSNAKAKYIIVSYNNTWEKLDARSNSKITDSEIREILWEKWEVILHEKDYKYYTTWKNNNIKNHKERLYVCKVFKD